MGLPAGDYRSESYKKNASRTNSIRKASALAREEELAKSQVNLDPKDVIRSSVPGITQVAIQGKPTFDANGNISGNVLQSPTPKSNSESISSKAPSPIVKALYQGQINIADYNNRQISRFEPVVISGGLANNLAGRGDSPQSIRDDQPYTTYGRIYNSRRNQSRGQSYNLVEAPKGLALSVDKVAKPSDYFRAKADEMEFQGLRAKPENKIFYEFGAFGISTIGSLTKPIRQPVSFFKENVDFFKSITTDPIGTGYQIGQQLTNSPGSFTGELAGNYGFGKLAFKLSPVKISKVVDLNLPKSVKGATSLIKGEALEGGKAVFSMASEDLTKKGLTTGYKIEFPKILGKKSGLSLFAPLGESAKGSVFIKSFAYTRFLEKNPLYAELLKTEITKEPKQSFTYKTEVIKRDGKTFIVDKKIPVNEPPSREIDVSSGGSFEPENSNQPDFIGGSGGELNVPLFKDLGKVSKDNKFSALGKVAGRQKSKLLLIESEYFAPEEVIRPFDRTAKVQLKIPSVLPFSVGFLSQKPVSSQINFSSQSPISAQANKTIPVSKLEVFGSQKSIFKSASSLKQVQSGKQKSISQQAQKVISIQSQAIVQSQTQSLAQVQRQFQKLKTKTLIAEFPLSFDFQFKRRFDDETKRSRRYRSKKVSRYTPSFDALFFKRYGKYNKKGGYVGSGLDYRPITKRFKLTGGNFKIAEFA